MSRPVTVMVVGGYASTDTAACTVNSAGLVTGIAAGTNNCIITATAAATDDWLGKVQPNKRSAGSGSPQTVTFTNAPLSAVVGGTVNGVATTSGDGAISYASTDTAACTVNSSGLVTVAAGTNTSDYRDRCGDGQLGAGFSTTDVRYR